MGVFSWSHPSPSWRMWRRREGSAVLQRLLMWCLECWWGKVPPWDPLARSASRPGDAQGSLQKVLLCDECEASW